jgi:hypothetical protein
MTAAYVSLYAASVEAHERFEAAIRAVFGTAATPWTITSSQRDSSPLVKAAHVAMVAADDARRAASTEAWATR